MVQPVWRSTAPEIFSSQTPITSEFGRCPRRARSLLWRELELFFLTLAGTADPRLPLSCGAQLVWRSTVPEISSSRTPVTSEFGRCPRPARSPLWQEMELVVLAGTADPRLPLSCGAQLVWRSTVPEISSSRTPVTSEFGRCHRRARSPLWQEMELVVLAGTADPRLPFSSVTHMVWRSTAPEIFSSRTPVTREFGRCSRLERSPLG